MPRAGLSTATVVDAAAALADEGGIDGVTLAAVADALGVRTPSLYNHVAGLDDLRRRLTVRALRDLGGAIAAATHGLRGADALAALCHAYRNWARARPGLAAFVVSSTEGAHPDVQAAGAMVLEIVIGVLGDLGLAGDDAVHGARCLRSAVHGFVSLEVADGFGLPLDLDESFARLVDLLADGLASGG